MDPKEVIDRKVKLSLVPVTGAFFKFWEIISRVAVTIESTANNRKYILIILEMLRE